MMQNRNSRRPLSLFERIAQRRTVTYLETLDDHMLSDLGLTRSDLKDFRRNPGKPLVRGG